MNDPKGAVVKLEEIEVGERFRQDYGNLQELVHSYNKHGFFSVLALGLNPEGSALPYKLLAGGRRFEACKLKGMKEVNCCIYDRELTPLELREIELAENIYRKDLGWEEKANLTAQIHELQTAIHGVKTSTSPNATGWSQAMTAEKMGKSVGQVSDALLLSKAVKMMPELKKCKTAEEAKKMILNMGNKFVSQDLAEKYQAKAAETPIEKIRMNLVNSFIIGDFFDGSPKLPDGFADLIEIDPPYGIDIKHMKKLEDQTDLKLSDYNEVDMSQYPIFLTHVLKEAYRILKPTGWLIMWFAHEPWFEVVYQSMQAQHFIGTRMFGQWQKQTGQSKRPELYLANTTELFFYARKSNGVIQKARNNSFTYPAVAPTRKIHPTERPIEMMMDILQTFCLPSSQIVVPFLGSGNTLLAAANVNMSAIGWDLTEQYKDAYTVRVHNGEPGYYTSYPNLEVLSA